MSEQKDMELPPIEGYTWDRERSSEHNTIASFRKTLDQRERQLRDALAQIATLTDQVGESEPKSPSDIDALVHAPSIIEFTPNNAPPPSLLPIGSLGMCYRIDRDRYYPVFTRLVDDVPTWCWIYSGLPIKLGG
jgi:hypothetical protein